MFRSDGISAHQLDGLPTKLPLVPLVILHDVALQHVRVRLCANLSLDHRFLDHFVFFFALKGWNRSIAHVFSSLYSWTQFNDAFED